MKFLSSVLAAADSVSRPAAVHHTSNSVYHILGIRSGASLEIVSVYAFDV